MVQPELLGEGSYGCVFRPEIACVTKKKYLSNGKVRERKTESVGKIFSDSRDFHDEWKISQRIAKIDPKGKTLLVPNAACITSRERVLRHPASGECEQLFYTPYDSSNKPLYQISMPYGGSDLYNYMIKYAVEKRTTLPVKTFAKMMLSAFDGVVLLDKRRFCHQDIKTPNIMVTPQGNAILIDYGLMVPYKDIYAPGNRKRLRYSYFPYPPEYKLAYYQWTACTDACDIEKEVMKNIHQFGSERARAYFSYISEEEVRKSIQIFTAKLHEHKNDLQKYLTRFANRIDVYSLGTSILDIIKYINLKSLNTKQRQAWDTLIRSIIHPNPMYRATPVKARALLLELQKIL